MATVFLILVRPARTLLRLKESPDWLGAFAVLAAIGVILFVIGSGSAIRATVEHLPPDATPGEREEIASSMQSDIAPQALLLPFRMLLGWSLFAFLLYRGARAFGGGTGYRYRHLLALEMHAEATVTAGQIGTAAGIPLPSLGQWIDSHGDFLLRSLLASANLSTLWYVVLLTAGVTVLCHQKKLRAFFIVAGSWGFVQALNLGVLNLIRHTFHFTL
jgi:Yip1 domain